MKIQLKLPALLCLGTLVALSACGKKVIPDNELAAKVNKQPITLVDFNAAVERNMARYKKQGHALPPGIEGRIKESVLRRLINEEIVRQKAEGLKIALSETDIEAKFAEHKGRFRTETAFADYLKRSGNTEENMKQDLKRTLLRDQVVEKMSGGVAVTDDDIKKYYDENVDRFAEKEKVKASRILVRVAPGASPADKAKAEKTAKDLQKKASKAGADFAALAKEHSQGPEAARGGELAWLPRGRMTAEFDAAVFSLEPTKVSQVVSTRLGFEIVKLTEKKEARQRPLDEVKESIKNSLEARRKNEKRRDVLRQLKEGAEVVTLLKFDDKKAASTAGAKPDLGNLRPNKQAPSAPKAGEGRPATGDSHGAHDGHGH